MQQERVYDYSHRNQAQKRIYQDHECEETYLLCEPEIDFLLKRNKLCDITNSDIKLGPFDFGIKPRTFHTLKVPFSGSGSAAISRTSSVFNIKQNNNVDINDLLRSSEDNGRIVPEITEEYKRYINRY
jgi:hypothetical protein